MQGKYEYQLKWKGYGEPTWEPEDALSCPELLKTFKEALEKKKKAAAETTPPNKGKRPSTGKVNFK